MNQLFNTKVLLFRTLIIVTKHKNVSEECPLNAEYVSEYGLFQENGQFIDKSLILIFNNI